jgi:hypothetical protein
VVESGAAETAGMPNRLPSDCMLSAQSIVLEVILR